ncbi:MAG: glutamate synthase subunit beta [Bifidobacteriaceae bacterium]|jgi:glutamate synthase (NADPH/NADH) small chain|nr:glutamate synthase subunit beta [Bifidobacteriaceae bacterium]
MADPTGFLKVRQRELPMDRPVSLRLLDFREVRADLPTDEVMLHRQAGRCMDCGVPFCHRGCPLGNLIPEWNDLAWRGDWRAASERLHATNNFPEFTGRICPALCEGSCVLGISQPPVTIESIEMAIVDKAFENNWITPEIPERFTGFTVAVVGSGPAGLAAAQQLTRVGHTVAVYERADRPGGLLRYGIPDFKLGKHHLDLRLSQMQAEGTRFRTGTEIGRDISWEDLRQRYDAVVVAVGSTVPRDLDLPGRELAGIQFAKPFLEQANVVASGRMVANQVTARDKHVIVIGGGDTGSDCVGTSLRQGAKSVTSLEIMPQPPAERPPHQPWPVFPQVFKTSSSHEEGGNRVYTVTSLGFRGREGRVEALEVADAVRDGSGRFQPVPGSERSLPADLVLIAMGFTGPEAMTLVEQLGLELSPRGTLARDARYATAQESVFVAGDAGRGQSLVVWAIAEGRAAAAAVDAYLQGSTELHSPIPATEAPMSL